MKKAILTLSVAALGACTADKSYESSGTVDTVVNNQDTTGLDIDLGVTRDTVNLPIIGMEKDTIIINKPVVRGRKPVEVKRPTVDITKKP